jgi:hypothetical protein
MAETPVKITVESFDLQRNFDYAKFTRFYSEANSYKIGPFSLRAIFNKLDEKKYVFIQKLSKSLNFPNGYLYLKGEEIEESLTILKQILDEIGTTAGGSTLPMLKDVPNIEPKDKRFWDDDYCKITSSKGIKIRPLRMSSGNYVVKILQLTEGPNPNILGRQMSLYVSQCQSFTEILEEIVEDFKPRCIPIVREEFSDEDLTPPMPKKKLKLDSDDYKEPTLNAQDKDADI